MAVIDNISATLSSFKINGSSTALTKLSGTYNTAEILNGGETLENELEYTFRVTGLQNHTIGTILTKTLLLTSTGDLCSQRNLRLEVNSVSFSGTIQAKDNVKTLISTPFVVNEEQTQNSYDIVLKVTSNDLESCYYGLQSLLIQLSDIPYQVQLLFTGPKNNRTANNIEVNASVIKKGEIPVTFAKDITQIFDRDTHNEEGRVYFLQDGIFVDGYQHGVNAPATNIKAGIVKLQDEFETDENGGIIAPDETGVAASPQLVYNMVQPATTEIRGTVILQNTFETDGGAIIAPEGDGIAASPQLVYNTLATAKNYVDTRIAGIPAPVKIEIEEDDDTISAIDDTLTISKDFKFDGTDKKMLYINWLEIVK